MKQLILALAVVFSLAYTTQSFAQGTKKKSTTPQNIILDDKNYEGETTVEVKNGKLYVDGKKISDIQKDSEIKIIKKNTIADRHSSSFDLDAMDSPFRPNRQPFGQISRKAMLGVKTADANPGARVAEIVAGSAAEKAGMKKGDIIISVDGKTIRTSNDLVTTIGEYDKNDEVNIQIERKGQSEELVATLQAPQLNNVPFNKMPSMGNFSLPFQNLEKMFDLTPNGGFQVFSTEKPSPALGIEVEESESGLEVVSVNPDGAAFKAGLKKGDQLKTIEGEEIESIAELQTEIVRNRKNKKMYLGVKRDGAIKTLPLVLPQAKKRAKF
jgi:serine protease Do